MPTAKELIKMLMKLHNAKRAKYVAPYVGVKPGGYAEHDKLLGISVPDIRKNIKLFLGLPLNEVEKLIRSEYHEIRSAAVYILVFQYKKLKDRKDQKRFFNFYIKNVELGYINNWDFIDISAPYITGPYLYDQENQGRTVLLKYANSPNVWLRRVGVLSTFYNIKQNEFNVMLILAEKLLNDEHHLIHKAVGWMLREIGKKEKEQLTQFLDLYGKDMPRVMLRYSIEKLSRSERDHYLGK
ncbi:uncharacterized protein LOC130644827 [Hydractinia symbiolongicarpus]|uniref:uncharacterized protein LOC130644827 n=1 Tax=Hydractinia symbiolongicarpus TaxID=13093 RepID=UPI002549D140|nr:uncharacterized protein LOC130644827 [Hydractinia symbiolongicarpus]